MSTLPSNRPDFGGRGGFGSRPGGAALPGAIAGAGLANRIGDRPGNLPGLGERRPGISQLPAERPVQERRQALHDRLVGEGQPGQLPARDWSQVRQNWQDRRDNVREDWQSYRDGARDDWQNWFDDHYSWYGGWYWGHAPAYWERWDHLWDRYPAAAAAGLTWWAANSLGYQFGYEDYTNPYYEHAMPAYYTEPVVSLPLEVSASDSGQSAETLPPGVSAEAIQKFDDARTAFMKGNYLEALKLTDQAILQMPHDAVLHEFRSLVLFALKQYPEAAATIHAVLAVGPGWDWKTLSGLYPDTDTYTVQLRALEDAHRQNPKAADIRFLLGYHYLSGGYPDEAQREFRRAAELRPNDAVAAELAATLAPRDAKAVKASDTPAPPSIAADDIAGTWTAAGQGTAQYSLNLRKTGTFTWRFTRGSRKQEVKGVYTLEGNVLGMEPDSGGVLLAELAVKGPDSLQFKMIGGAADDPGLDFRRGLSK
jgi:tetratricopeptide (TPR) repeat protein